MLADNTQDSIDLVNDVNQALEKVVVGQKITNGLANGKH